MRPPAPSGKGRGGASAFSEDREDTACRSELLHILGVGLAFGSVLMALVWLPFGFRLGALIEAWNVLGHFAREGVFYIAGPETPLQHHSMRPLTVFPHALAFALDNDGFLAWHLILIAAFLAKFGAMAAIGWRLSGSPVLSLWFGATAILYPADTMQFAFRSFHIEVALALLLVAVTMFLAALDAARRPAIRGLLSGLSALLALLACLMYETSLFLLPMPFLLDFARHGLSSALRQLRGNWLPWLLWTGAFAVSAIYMVVVWWQGGTYQSTVVGIDRTAVDALMGRLPELFRIGLLRALVGGWWDAVGIVRFELRSVVYPALATLILAVGLLVARGPSVRQTSNGQDRFSAIVLWRWTAAGLVLAALGYVPYLASTFHLQTTQRTYIYASPGAALVWLAALALLSRIARPVMMGVVTASLFLALTFQLFQFHHYQGIFERQRLLLSAIVAKLGPDPGDGPIVVKDRTATLIGPWIFATNLYQALSYLYDRPIEIAEACLVPDGVWPRTDRFGRTGTCRETPRYWLFEPLPPLAADGEQGVSRMILKARARTITIDDLAETPRTIAQDNANSPDSAFHRRVQSILSEPSWPPFDLKMFDPLDPVEPPQSYRWDFGRWWDFETPLRGFGWWYTAWSLDLFDNVSVAWQNRPKAEIVFALDPVKDRDYLLTARIQQFASKEAEASLEVSVNGHPVDATLTADLMLSGRVSGRFLKRGTNILVFSNFAPTNPAGLLMLLDWVEIGPNGVR